MRSLILGCGGQDGPYLANHLRSQGYDVLGVAHPLENTDVIKARAPDMDLKLLDVQDPLAVQNILSYSCPDEIYMLAALSAPAIAQDNAIVTMHSATDCLIIALDWIASRAPDTRLFHCSSASIFGRAACPQSEITVPSPNSLYAVSKMAAHHLVRLYREKHSIFAVNGILYNHESIWRPEYYVTRKVTKAAALQKHVSLGNAQAVRDWGYAGDYVRAMHTLLMQKSPLDAVIGSGQGYTVEHLAETAYKLMGLDYEQYACFDPALEDDLDALVADTSLLQLTGWKPEVGFHELVYAMLSADLARAKGATEQELAQMESRGDFLPVPCSTQRSSAEP